MHVKSYPTAWQRKTMWAALTALFIVFLLVTAASIIWVTANFVSFLQPILIPVAIAAILAYLLDPLVTRLSRGSFSRTQAVVLLFIVAGLTLAAVCTWVVPAISVQGASLTRELPAYTQRARDGIVDMISRYNRAIGSPASRGKSTTSELVRWFLNTSLPHASPTPSPSPAGSPSAVEGAVSPATEVLEPAPSKLTVAEQKRIQDWVQKQIPNLERQLPALTEKLWLLLKKSIGGFLGVTGFLLSLVLVPIYLFFFLKERPRIERRWKDYLPLRDSPFKKEVVEVISEINSYIIAYFRGQLLVCLVDGFLIGAALSVYGLNFAPLIGALVVVLTMIPYIGIILCWIPAVLIALVQFGGWHPLWITLIFILVQNLEGWFYAPRIIGNSVGLHPLTVIISIFVWGLLIGGLLGPILAIPLTAATKVLLSRYVWGPQVREEIRHSIEDVPVVDEESASRAPA